jgi:hypothetical protein
MQTKRPASPLGSLKSHTVSHTVLPSCAGRNFPAHTTFALHGNPKEKAMTFPYLRSTMVPLAIGCFAGAVVIAGLTAGYYGWQLFAIAGLVGVALGVPFGLWNVRRMRATKPLDRPESPTMDPSASLREVYPYRGEPYPPAPDQGRT